LIIELNFCLTDIDPNDPDIPFDLVFFRFRSAFPIILLVFAFLITRIKLIYLEGWAAYFWQGIYPIMAGVALFLVLYLIFDWKYGEAGIEQGLGIHIPFLRQPVRQILLARFLKAYASLTAAGVYFPQSFKMSLESIGSGFLNQPIKTLIEQVQQGKSLAAGFRASKAFPPSVLQLMQTGEKTGNLVEMAFKAASMLEEEAEHKLHQVFRLFSLVFYLAVVVYIAYEVFSYWSTYVNEIIDLT